MLVFVIFLNALNTFCIQTKTITCKKKANNQWMVSNLDSVQCLRLLLLCLASLILISWRHTCEYLSSVRSRTRVLSACHRVFVCSSSFTVDFVAMKLLLETSTNSCANLRAHLQLLMLCFRFSPRSSIQTSSEHQHAHQQHTIKHKP